MTASSQTVNTVGGVTDMAKANYPWHSARVPSLALDSNVQALKLPRSGWCVLVADKGGEYAKAQYSVAN